MALRNFYSASKLSRALQEIGISPRKQWGQNFLIDRNIINSFVGYYRDFLASVGSQKIERLAEIGAGLGVITEELLQNQKTLCIFEIDPGCNRYLRVHFSEFLGHGLTLYEGDVLDLWDDECSGPAQAVLGNLPFIITSRILLRILQSRARPSYMLFIVQQEIAERLTAKMGTKDYAPISILTQLCYRLQPRRNIAPQSFYPKPRVSATILEFTELSEAGRIEKQLLQQLSEILFACFMHRRKILRRSLMLLQKQKPETAAAIGAACSEHQLALRPEEISPEEWLAIAECMPN